MVPPPLRWVFDLDSQFSPQPLLSFAEHAPARLSDFDHERVERSTACVGDGRALSRATVTLWPG